MDLSKLVEGEKARIINCNNYRLMEYGFIENTPLTIYRKVNGVTAIYLKRTIIACRNSDLKDVYIEKFVKKMDNLK